MIRSKTHPQGCGYHYKINPILFGSRRLQPAQEEFFSKLLENRETREEKADSSSSNP